RLSKNLDEEERYALLMKIKKEKETDKASVSNNKKKNAIQRQFKLARNEYEKSSFLTKIIILIMSIFEAKKKEEVILDRMFKEIKKEIQTKFNNIIDFKTNTLTNDFAKEILNLADACKTVFLVIDRYFGDPLYYYGFLSSILEKNFSNELKSMLEDINPRNFEIKFDYVDKEEFFMEKEKRLKKFFQHIELATYNNITSNFLNFEIIIRLIRFDYNALLYYFFKDDTSINKSNMQGTKFSIIDNLLEKLYTLINSILFDYNNIIFIEEMNEYNKQFPISGIQTDNTFSEKEIKLIKNIFEVITNFKTKVPLRQIFQYFKKDLLYKPASLNIKINFIALYKDYKKNKINIEWENYYNKIKEINLTKLIQGLFKNYDYNTLNYFTLELKQNVDAHSYLKLKSVKKLNILTQFIEKIYKNNIEKIINRILIDGNFIKDSYRNNLSSSYYLLYNSSERIREFDKSLNPERDIGKKISTFIKISSKESEYTQTLQNTIIDVNDTSAEIIDEIFNALWNVKDLFINILNNTDADNLIVQNIHRIKVPGCINPIEVITKNTKSFDIFFKIFKYTEDY
ncbi:MAG: hypothetical protein KAT05_02135, partial [Spirochaetes bacterium]|nr:hypothetical protein [Spirochaetota bacterium]